MQPSNQKLISQPKPSSEVALYTNSEAKDKLDRLLLACYSVQKMYGRAPESFDTITAVFHSLLGKFPANKAVRAFEIWMERSQEFPTPADLINLIRRNGKPPLKESDIIAIRKKDGENRSRADWDTLKEWDEQQQDGWEFEDEEKDEATFQENIRLRQQVGTQKTEIARLNALLHDTRIAKGIEKPTLTVQEKIDRTVSEMRAAGAPQADIDEFLASSAA